MNAAKLSDILNLQIHSYWLTSPHALRKVFLTQVISRGPDSLTRWKITEGSYTLSKVGEWVWEPSPSNRTEDYIKENYYDRIEDALTVWNQHKGEFIKDSQSP